MQAISLKTIAASLVPLVLTACSGGQGKAEAEASAETSEATPAPAQAAVPGKLQFLQCAACHAVEADAAPKVGPNLNCVIGRAAGSLAEFNYSSAFESAAAEGLVWNRETMLSFLEKPMEVVPGNAMAFGGVARPEDREAITDYLEQMCEADVS